MTNVKGLDLFPNPGPLPTSPAPQPGDVVEITVDGEPPSKDVHLSIRNTKHPRYQSFSTLRCKAIEAMQGRKWYDGPVEVEFTLYAPVSPQKDIWDLEAYFGGIADTLDGSHGFTFTYLPVVYQDDHQIKSAVMKIVDSSETKYTLKITFL